MTEKKCTIINEVRTAVVFKLPKPFRLMHVFERGAGSRQSLHIHDFFHINSVTSGTVQILANGEAFTLSGGQVFIIRPQVPHSHYSESGYTQIGIDMFDEEDERGLCSFFKEIFPNPVTIVSLTDVPKGFEEVYRMARTMSTLNFLKTANFVDSTIIRLLETYDKNLKPFRDRFLDILEQNKNYLLSLDQICTLFKLSKTHIERLCNHEFGCGVREYCNKIKLMKASLLLETTNLPIKEIAHELNFYDLSHFNSFFKKKKGVTPSQYRCSSRKTV